MTKWQPIETAPRDGTEILILTPLGVSQAWFSQGVWEDHHEYGPEYTGSLWVCLDDNVSFEVEEYKDESGKAAFCDDPIEHWMPLPEAPND